MKVTRRQLLRIGAGFAGAGALGLAGCSPRDALRRLVPQRAGRIPEKPNLLVLFTDQERYHVHFPPGYIERVMPSWTRLKRHGLEFRRAYTSSTQCSPSRACMLTGEYSNVNRLPYLDFPNPVLPPSQQLPSVATVLAGAGYDVAWKGKWHLSFPLAFQGGPPSNEPWTAADIAAMQDSYGWKFWNPPDAGNNAFDSAGARATMGGAAANNDGRFATGTASPGQTPGYGQSALEYLAGVGSTPKDRRQPFCLFVSLVNPHDIVFYPNGWDQGGYRLEAFADLDIGVPASFADPLTTKPAIQTAFRKAMDDDGPLPTEAQRRRFVRFYAYLHGYVEPQLQAILDALDQHRLTEETIVVRTADHGEHGLAHGLREKGYSAYEEIIHVPLVVSNPRLFPRAAETDAFYTHVDLLPTLAELAGTHSGGVGRSLVPVLENPAAAVQDSVLFAYDDHFILPQNAPGSHIRALRNARWTYAVYYSADGSSLGYELYDNPADVDQMVNLVHDPSADIRPVWKSLHEQLTAHLRDKNALPQFAWPEDPTKS